MELNAKSIPAPSETQLGMKGDPHASPSEYAPSIGQFSVAKSVAPASLKNFTEDQRDYQYIRVIIQDNFKKVDSGANLLRETQSPIEPKYVIPTVKATPITDWNQDAGILSYSEIDLPKPRFKNTE